MLTFEFGVSCASRPHQTRTNSRNSNSVLQKFRTKPFGKADERKLAGTARNKMRNAKFAAYRGNVDDSACAPSLHFRKHGERCVYWTPEMRVHGDAEVFESHNFKRANFNHAGVLTTY